jgi:hypothetical protein
MVLEKTTVNPYLATRGALILANTARSGPGVLLAKG